MHFIGKINHKNCRPRKLRNFHDSRTHCLELDKDTSLLIIYLPRQPSSKSERLVVIHSQTHQLIPLLPNPSPLRNVYEINSSRIALSDSHRIHMVFYRVHAAIW